MISLDRRGLNTIFLSRCISGLYAGIILGQALDAYALQIGQLRSQPSTGGETVSAPDNIQTWQMVKVPIYDKEARKGTAPGELQRVEIPVPELSPGEVLVKIAGCGVCRTDMAYFYDGVPTMTKPPLTLGHEIAGTVVPAGPGAEIMDRKKRHCARGHALQQLRYLRPGKEQPLSRTENAGNSLGIYVGFSSHIPRRG